MQKTICPIPILSRTPCSFLTIFITTSKKVDKTSFNREIQVKFKYKKDYQMRDSLQLTRSFFMYLPREGLQTSRLKSPISLENKVSSSFHFLSELRCLVTIVVKKIQ